MVDYRSQNNAHGRAERQLSPDAFTGIEGEVLTNAARIRQTLNLQLAQQLQKNM